MIRPLLSLERLSLDEREGKVCYRYGEKPEEVERMDYLEFIAQVTSHSAAFEPLWPTRRDFRWPLTSYFVMIYIS